MAVSAKTAPPNSLLLLMDSLGGEIPKSMGGGLVASTESCIAVGCKSEADGETEVVLGLASEVDPGRSPDFEGRLDTPSCVVAVKSVHGGRILELIVPNEEVTVRIWVNDRDEPDRVVFGVI